MNRTCVGILLLSAGLALAGCGGAEVVTTTTTVSVGQQLIDLKTARDSGAMSASEYDREKKKIISRALD